MRDDAIAARAAADQAVQAFYAAWPDATKARDLVEHFDEYFIGQGRHQITPSADGSTTWGAIEAAEDGRWNFRMFDVTVPLAAVVKASVALSAGLDAVWAHEVLSADPPRHIGGCRRGGEATCHV
jgi:hypothetical protein